MLNKVIEKIIGDPLMHARWLNTLSYLENCGARKIAACEHPTKVKKEMLKHAEEEFRHAHHLKKQIGKVYDDDLHDYSLQHILGGYCSYHYLRKLDFMTCKYLVRTMKSSGNAVSSLAYLFVTYAIELRAKELYEMYHQELQKSCCRVSVSSILHEEEEHLLEMHREISQIENGFSSAEKICEIEQNCYQKWLLAIAREVINHQ